MSDLIIKNDVLNVCITTLGAQIKSVKSDKEYMWEGNPDIWGKHAPVLFPVCGRLKDGKYTYKGKEELYYSVGCHEAYACPEGIEEYYLEFPDKLDLDEYILDGPFMSGETRPFAKECDILPLTEKLFENDSTCFKNMGTYTVTLKNKAGTRSVKVDYPDFDYFIRHIPGAPYICLEPWKGFPDYTTTDGDFTKKDGIMKVEAGQRSTSEHTITFA